MKKQSKHGSVLLFTLALVFTISAIISGVVYYQLTQKRKFKTINVEMGQRYGEDKDLNGLIDYFSHPNEVNPSSFSVLLDICKRHPRAASYLWEIDNHYSWESDSCATQIDLPEGSFELTVEADNTLTSQDLVVDDILIVALGDSYGSGEGNPDKPLNAFENEQYQEAVVDYQLAKAELESSLKTLLDTEKRYQQLLDLNDALLARLEAEGFNIAKRSFNQSLEDIMDVCQNVPTSLKGLQGFPTTCKDAFKQFSFASEQLASSVTTVMNDYAHELSDESKAYLDSEIQKSIELQEAIQEVNLVLADLDSDCVNPNNRANLVTCLGSLKHLTQPLAQLTKVATSLVIDNFEQRTQKVQQSGLVDTKVEEAKAVFDAAQTTWHHASDRLNLAGDLITDVLGGLSATWQHEICHRSSQSAQAQVAQEIEALYPHNSVTFIHLSCSGASIEKGILGPHRGQVPQLEALQTLIGDREIDILLLSVGGNDIGFSDILKSCALHPSCHETGRANLSFDLHKQCQAIVQLAHPEERSAAFYLQTCLSYFAQVISGGLGVDSAYDIFEAKYPYLDNHYDALATAFERSLAANFNDSTQVYLTEYMDITKDDRGRYCAFGDHLARQFPGVTLEETIWVDKAILQPLQDGMKAASQKHGWTYVDGIYAASKRHGYCATDGWVLRLQNSIFLQGDLVGAMHPNVEGQAMVAEQLLQALSNN